MKFFLILTVLISTVYGQLTVEDMADPEKVSAWEKRYVSEVIGYRETVTRISSSNYLVTGTLHGRPFIAIQSDNGQPEQTLVHCKKISAAHLERMLYIAYVEKNATVNNLIEGNKKITVQRIYGNAWSGFKEEQEMVILRGKEGKKWLEPINDLNERYDVQK